VRILFLKSVQQVSASTRQAGHHGTDGRRNDLGDFAIVESVNVPQDDRLAKLDGKIFDRGKKLIRVGLRDAGYANVESDPITELDTRFSNPAAVATPWEDVRRVIERAELFWISTVRADGRPHSRELIETP
jgi:hypothetical protein